MIITSEPKAWVGLYARHPLPLRLQCVSPLCVVGRRSILSPFVLQSPILGTHFITPAGHAVPAHHLRAPALRVPKKTYLTAPPVSPHLKSQLQIQKFRPHVSSR